MMLLDKFYLYQLKLVTERTYKKPTDIWRTEVALLRCLFWMAFIWMTSVSLAVAIIAVQVFK